MKTVAARIATALAAGSLLLAGAAADAKPRLTPEQELAKALEGRVAGKPESCLYLPRVTNTRIYDKTAIVYDTGKTLWVNRPESGAGSLDDNDIMVTTPFGSQLCNVDIVRMIDRTAGFWRGSVGLGQFVPYTKVKAEAEKG
ncbi:hypothetical protein [Novosphingobium sp. CECT 9465]|uniref:hypothetical protein n=1 Tax=Novosphingobium sp. CECT 9465 TaxID=2829794 RepID=UPI001E5EC2F6|nr:hypothetical protein [Novosphingobium sp. CECT 9465]CAH0495180.1 hypothetical protein NVSP9465_00185 [Novosphingobium sp. CECT 9465]